MDGIEHQTGIGSCRPSHHDCALPCLPEEEIGTGAGARVTWSMPHCALPWKTSENFFLRRMSSRSGEPRSGRNGTKMGFGPDECELVLAGKARFGWGACTGVVVRIMGPCAGAWG